MGDPYNLLEDGIQANDLISGFYTFDSEIPGSAGVYLHTTAPCGISVTIGDLIFQTDLDDVNFTIDVTNAGADIYIVRSDNNLGLDNGIGNMYRIRWRLDDSSGTALSSDALPLEPLDLSQWQYNCFSIYGSGYPSPPIEDNKTVSFEVLGRVTDVWLIPEPATLILVGLGGLLIRKRC